MPVPGLVEASVAVPRVTSHNEALPFSHSRCRLFDDTWIEDANAEALTVGGMSGSATSHHLKYRTLARAFRLATRQQEDDQ
jgi:hypothetical protein